MIANCAFAAAMVVVGIAAWLARDLTFLAPHKALIFREYGPVIGGGLLLVFLNLTAIFYAFARWLFLRETGRKLSHLDRQLTTADAVLHDLRHLDSGTTDHVARF